MIATLYGAQDINFTNSNGEQICGVNLFVGFADNNVEGQRTEKFFLNLKDGFSLPTDIHVGDRVELTFNYKGKLESIKAPED